MSGAQAMRTIQETITAGAGWLESRGVSEARLNLEHLLANVLGCRRLDLYLQFDRPLGEEQLAPLRELMRRRAAREPLQHLLGNVPFCGHSFTCDARALIPRPETEELAMLLIARLGKTEPAPARILDMGTGSGVLGLSLAAAWTDCHATLVDISDDALALAETNCSKLELDAERITLARGDLFEAAPGTYDLITANLPYIPSAEIATLEAELKHDPILALDGGADGFDVIRRFVAALPAHLADGGTAALEVGSGQGAAVAALLSAAGYPDAIVVNDASGHDRFVFSKPLPAPLPPARTPDPIQSETLPE